MFAHRVPLFKLFGFQVWIDWSWLILALLITWSLATAVFPMIEGPTLDATTRWVMGAAGAIGLFLSIVLHELGHSLVARRFGMRMNGITLFVFGGVAEMGDEPPTPKAELLMAIAGPIVSVIIGLIMIGITTAVSLTDGPASVSGVTGWLGMINLILAGFNLIPAFPLDGGRVLRALIWNTSKNLRKATRITSNIGLGFGAVLITLGALSLIMGNMIGGIWWIILGLFIRGAARSSYQQVMVRRALEGEKVSRFMSPDPVTVDAGMTLHELIEDYFYTHYHKLYPVTENGRLVGCVTVRDAQGVDRSHWDDTKVGEITRPCDDTNTVAPDEDAMKALEKLSRAGSSRMMVVEDQHVVGILSLKDLMQFLSMKSELERD